MVPGLWLELEVMGVLCPLADKVPGDWFFQRHGRRVQVRGRYQLDFRHPGVTKHADEVIDRLVKDYKVGYIKMDYNSDAGIGTERDADSAGDGLLQHNRAYLAWLDRVFERYPDLVIENCGSGGMRMDYALLSRHSIQSSSDQMDYRNYAAIAAAAPGAIAPEQCAVWSYPMREGDEEETVFNMVNALLQRIHQSGHLAELSPARMALVKEGIAYYKSIRGLVPQGRSFWPLGLPQWGDSWHCLGLEHGGKRLLAVWRLKGGEAKLSLPLRELKGREAQVRVAYPKNKDAGLRWNRASGVLELSLEKEFSARILEIDAL
jgi:alpha-galactosidase